MGELFASKARYRVVIKCLKEHRSKTVTVHELEGKIKLPELDEFYSDVLAAIKVAKTKRI